MSLRTHDGRSGEWSFRRRRYLPLALVLLLVAIATEPNGVRRVLSPAWAAATRLVSAGLAVRGWLPARAAGLTAHVALRWLERRSRLLWVGER